jgi:hypothetical protein
MARQTLTGIVEAVNERGVRINGTWHNYSAYARNGDIDRTAQQGDKVEAEITSTGWIRSLRILERAQAQATAQAAQQPTNGVGARALDAAQYTRLRAVEIAATAAVQFSEDFEAYMQNLNALANWIVSYVEGGDPLG